MNTKLIPCPLQQCVPKGRALADSPDWPLGLRWSRPLALLPSGGRWVSPLSLSRSRLPGGRRGPWGHEVCPTAGSCTPVLGQGGRELSLSKLGWEWPLGPWRPGLREWGGTLADPWLWLCGPGGLWNLPHPISLASLFTSAFFLPCSLILFSPFYSIISLADLSSGMCQF